MKVESFSLGMLQTNCYLLYREKEKKWKWLPNRPIVFQRGEVVHERVPRIAAEFYGVEDYIAKPFTTSGLLVIIKETLKRAKV